MLCPKCGKQAMSKGSSPNGGELFVAEDMKVAVECYDSPITEFVCPDGHTFYSNPG